MIEDLSGRRFGRFTVQEFSHNKRGNNYWICKCDCGTIKQVRGSHLRRSEVVSCKCYNNDRGRIQLKKHGLSKTPTWNIWMSMLQRCCDPRTENYRLYGGRGITVCGRWRDYRNFLADMGERPKGLSIDRIDNDGNYEPSNCRWTTTKIQCRNRRVNVRLTVDGITKCLQEWSEISGINPATITWRIRHGKSMKDAIFGKVRRKEHAETQTIQCDATRPLSV